MLGENKAAVVVMGNFKSQIVESVVNKLNTQYYGSLTTIVNKPAKTLLKRKFVEWSTYEIVKQLEGQNGGYQFTLSKGIRRTLAC